MDLAEMDKAITETQVQAQPAERPKKMMRNSWYFANLNEPIGQRVWEIGQAYYRKVTGTVNRLRNNIPIPLIKANYFMYLSGCRPQEIFLQPYPKLEIISIKGGTYVAISHVNEKHFSRYEMVGVENGRKKYKATGPRELVNAAIPIFDEWEKLMWAFITDGGTSFDAEHIFAYSSWKSFTKHNLSGLFVDNFKTDLKDENGVVHKEAGLAPYILRHMRAYNVLIQNQVPQALAMKWFGWSSADMLYYYAHIKKALSIEEQLGMLKKNNMLKEGMNVDLSEQLGV